MKQTRWGGAIVAVLLLVGVDAVRAAEKNNYTVTILVSDEEGEAPFIDADLVNAWGLARGSGPSPSETTAVLARRTSCSSRPDPTRRSTATSARLKSLNSGRRSSATE